MLKENKIAERVSIQAAIYFTAVLEYITAEVLDSTIIAMRDKTSKTVTPHDVIKGISSDHELTQLFRETQIESYDPKMKTERIYVIGRGVDENYYRREQNKVDK